MARYTRTTKGTRNLDHSRVAGGGNLTHDEIERQLRDLGHSVGTGSTGAQPDLVDVTLVNCSTATPVLRDGLLRGKVTLTVQSPGNLGSGDTLVKFVQVYCATGSGLLQLEAVDVPAVGQTADIDVYLTYPDGADETYVLYLCSRSDRYEDPITAATPHASVDMLGDSINWDAPGVRVFAAGTLNTSDGTFAPSVHWETPLNKRMLIDWGCLLPADTTNWSAVAIYIRTASGAYVQATGWLNKDEFLPADTGVGYVHYDCISIEGADLPAAPEQWQFIACSRNRAGLINSDVDGNPVGPTVLLMTQVPPTVPTFDEPGLPTAMSVNTVTLSGTKRCLNVTYTPPQDGKPFKGAQFLLEYPIGSAPQDLGLIDSNGNLLPQLVGLWVDAPKDADTNCRLWLVPYSATVSAKLVTAGGGISPHVDFSLPRFPLCVQPTGVTAQVNYSTDEGKNPTYSFSGTWNVVAEATRMSIAVDCLFNDGYLVPLGEYEHTDGSFRTSPPWVITNPQGCTLKFYSVNLLGVRTLIAPATVALNVARDTTTTGQENANYVAAFTASAYYDYGSNPDGLEHWRLGWSVTPPAADKRWAGYKLVLRPRGGGADATIEPAGDQVYGPWWPMGANETYDIYCVSRDAAYRYNTIKLTAPATPSVAVAVSAQTTGKVKANRLDSTTYDTTIFGNVNSKFAQIAVDMGKPKAGTYDTQLFQVVGPVFKAKLSNQFSLANNALEITTIDCDLLRSGNINVGNITGRPAGIFCYQPNGSGGQTLVAWLGFNGALVGGWAKEFYIGGTGIGDAKIYCNSAGTAVFNGTLGSAAVLTGSVSITASAGYTTSITTDGFKISYAAGAGVLAATNSELAISSSNANLALRMTYSSFSIVYGGLTGLNRGILMNVNATERSIFMMADDGGVDVAIYGGSSNGGYNRGIELGYNSTLRLSGYDMIDSTGHVGNIRGKHKPRYFDQLSQPTLDDGELALWWDKSQMWLCWYNAASSNFFKWARS